VLFVVGNLQRKGQIDRGLKLQQYENSHLKKIRKDIIK